MDGQDAALSVDVIHLICDELSARNDFDSLFNCVVSSKYIAASGAVNSLYRISHECFTGAARSRDVPEEAALASQILQKTTILWRSIILSSLDKTIFPYCQHLRVLDLRDLGGLLDDGRFSAAKTADYFFGGPMSRFLVRYGNTTSTRSRGLNVAEILLRVSDTVLQRAMLIESLSEPSNATLFARMLPNCTDKLSHLRQLDLASGELFNDADMRAKLRQNCPNLQELRIFSYAGDQADANLADFLDGLKAGQLLRFENFSQCGIKEATCTALGRHETSLRQLKLTLDEDGFKALPNLASCTNIETLALEGMNLSANMKDTAKAELEATVDWLKNCHKLSDIYIKNVSFTPDLITPVLETHNDLMQSLRIEADTRSLFDLGPNLTLASAIGTQTRLEVLHMAANAETATEQQQAEFVMDLCVSSLRHLELRHVPDYWYQATDITTAILQSLPMLETLYYSSAVLGDYPLTVILTSAKELKSMTFAGVSGFSFQALLAFVNNLSPGNYGFNLTIDFAAYENALDLEQQEIIRSRLATEHGGTFSYTLIREEADDFTESDSSD